MLLRLRVAEQLEMAPLFRSKAAELQEIELSRVKKAEEDKFPRRNPHNFHEQPKLCLCVFSRNPKRSGKNCFSNEYKSLLTKNILPSKINSDF